MTGAYNLVTEETQLFADDFYPDQAYGDLVIVENLNKESHYWLNIQTGVLSEKSIEEEFKSATGYNFDYSRKPSLLDEEGTSLLYIQSLGVWVRHKDGTYAAPFKGSSMPQLYNGVLCQSYRDPETHEGYEEKYTIETRAYTIREQERGERLCHDKPYENTSTAGRVVKIKLKNETATLIDGEEEKPININMELLTE